MYVSNTKIDRIGATILQRSSDFIGSESGSFLIKFSLLLPILLTSIGMTIDFAGAVHQKAVLQKAVDFAALATAHELTLAGSEEKKGGEIVKNAVKSWMKANNANYPIPEVATQTQNEGNEVRVTAKQERVIYFGNLFGSSGGALKVTAIARVMGSPNICMLGLHPDMNATIGLDKNAKITGNGCSVFFQLD